MFKCDKHQEAESGIIKMDERCCGLSDLSTPIKMSVQLFREALKRVDQPPDLTVKTNLIDCVHYNIIFIQLRLSFLRVEQTRCLSF